MAHRFMGAEIGHGSCPGNSLILIKTDMNYVGNLGESNKHIYQYVDCESSLFDDQKIYPLVIKHGWLENL